MRPLLLFTLLGAVLSCGTAPSPANQGQASPPSASGLPPSGGAAPPPPTILYALADLGDMTSRVAVNAADVRGRISGGVYTYANDGWTLTGGVFTPGSGWSAAPVPNGATSVEVVGIDASGCLALNAYVSCDTPHGGQGTCLLGAYRASPLEPLGDGPATAVHPLTGHIIGLDALRPYLFDGTDIIRIAPPTGSGLLQLGLPRALNRNDQVAGSCVDAGLPCGYVWDHGAVAIIQRAGDYLEATAISENGLVAGETYREFPNEVFLWDGDLHSIPCPTDICYASGINNRREMIVEGISNPGASSTSVALLYRDGGLYRLDEVVEGAAGWSLHPMAIFDDGSIAGIGQREGTYRAFLLEPR